MGAGHRLAYFVPDIPAFGGELVTVVEVECAGRRVVGRVVERRGRDTDGILAVEIRGYGDSLHGYDLVRDFAFDVDGDIHPRFGVDRHAQAVVAGRHLVVGGRGAREDAHRALTHGDDQLRGVDRLAPGVRAEDVVDDPAGLRGAGHGVVGAALGRGVVVPALDLEKYEILGGRGHTGRYGLDAQRNEIGLVGEQLVDPDVDREARRTAAGLHLDAHGVDRIVFGGKLHRVFLELRVEIAFVVLADCLEVQPEFDGDVLVEPRRAAGIDGQLSLEALLPVFELLPEDVVFAADNEYLLAVKLLFVILHFTGAEEGGRSGEYRYFAECFHLLNFLELTISPSPGSDPGSVLCAARCGAAA